MGTVPQKTKITFPSCPVFLVEGFTHNIYCTPRFRPYRDLLRTCGEISTRFCSLVLAGQPGLGWLDDDFIRFKKASLCTTAFNTLTGRLRHGQRAGAGATEKSCPLHPSRVPSTQSQATASYYYYAAWLRKEHHRGTYFLDQHKALSCFFLGPQLKFYC